uniref:NACHT domain-containing protein n=1 Tax=Tetraodon nigroviridis TaxID=99883 RepID=H3CIK7_TETNG
MLSLGLVDDLQKVLEGHKISLKSKCEHVTEGTQEAGRGTLLNKIYTELYITEGRNEEVNTQHEVRQLEMTSKKNVQDTPIKCHQIFNALSDKQKHIRVVLTNGVAGIGKTFSVQKFSLDWAEGLENQDISLLVLLSFRELNLIKDEQFSLLSLLHIFHPTLEKIRAEDLNACKLLLVLDGLDESRHSLDFTNREVISDVTRVSSVNVLLVNLIQGNLLPSALIWITSRPAAANQIPPCCLDRVTEVRGFTDSQKEEYFRRRFHDEDLSKRVISHVKASRSLHIMCLIPVFCWITAKVLEDMLTAGQKEQLPKSLTDLYSHFLVFQMRRKKQKYEGHQRPEELAEADSWGGWRLNIWRREQCGLDVSGVSVHSGVCTEMFRRENIIFQKSVYCFVHLSVQEFLAAVYILLNLHEKTPPVDDFLSRVMKKSLESPNGHLDLFVRFLHGLSLKSNQRILGRLLNQTENHPDTTQKTINNLKEMKSDTVSPDRSINIFHCLLEMNDDSVHQEIQEFLKSQKKSEKRLSEIQRSPLAYLLQMVHTSEEGRRRLIPAVRNCRKAQLISSNLSETHCEFVASALTSSPSELRELNLSESRLQESGVKLLCAGLESPNCKLETLILNSCGLSEISCGSLASSVTSNPSFLKELNLNSNKLLDSGVKLLCAGLESPNCKLEILRLLDCSLSERSCHFLASALKSEPSRLRVLNLSENQLLDSGVKLLCAGLESPNCKLEILRLWNCGLSERSCDYLASALTSNPSHLRILNLSENKLQDPGVKRLCAYLQNPLCQLDTLSMRHCSLSEKSCGCLATALRSSPSHLRVLNLSHNELQDSGVELLCDFLQNSLCELETLRMWNCGLSESSCNSLAAALECNPSHLRELNLSENKLQDSGVKLLSDLVNSPTYKLETLGLTGI